MSKIITFLFICIISSSSGLSSSTPRTLYHWDPEFTSHFESKIKSLYKEYELQGDFILGIVDEKGLVYSYALNRDLPNGKNSSLNNHTPFYVASHTKAFTGTLLKILEEHGILNLDKSLHDYLPELTLDGKVDTKTVTVRQLLNHTAGFSSTLHSYKTAYLGYSVGSKELVQALNSNISTTPFGKFSYSNTGPNIAGMIVEKVTGNDWKGEMEKRIFEPLNMANTSTHVSYYNAEQILPAVRTTAENTVYRSGFYKTDETMGPAGGVISNLNDLSQWLRFNIKQETSILKDSNSFIELHQTTISQDKKWFTYKRYGYSLGWDIANYQNETILTRFGGYAGTGIHVSFMPSRKIGIIAFFNESGSSKLPHLAANYAYNLISNNVNAESIFEEEKEIYKNSYEREKSKAPSMALEIRHSDLNDKFIGVYQNSDGWPDITIKREKDSYLLKWGILSGPILNSQKLDCHYIAALGATDRTICFQVKDGNVGFLINGSLKFKKID